MLRIVIWPVIIFSALGAALFAMVILATPEQSLLTQETINSVNNAPSASVDPLGFDDLGGGTAASEDPKVAELKRLQEKVQAVLIKSIGIAVGLGFVCAVGWGFHAYSLEPSVTGPKSQRRGFPGWFGLMLAYVVAFGVLYWFLAVDPLIAPDPIPYWTRLGIIIVAGLIGYWLATILVVSVTMRPSVPFASILTRSGKGA